MAAHSCHSITAASANGGNASSSDGVFQMPSYTSHTSRGAGVGSPGRLKKHAPKQFVGEFSVSGISPGKPSRSSAAKGSHSDSDQSLLEMLNSTVACLKQKHMDLEALGCLEQSLWLKRRMFGVDNSVVQRALNDVVLSYNSVAMQYLAQAQFDQCLAMLRKAEAITAPGNFRKCQSLQILTFNNIGCCYRKLGKLKSALKYLKEAAQIGATCAHVKNLSITHLNLCAIQSQLGRHDLALEHAQAAIFHTQEELVNMEAAAGSSGGSSTRRDEDDDDSSGCDDAPDLDVLDAKSREEKVISLAVAYHNLAVELEFNGRGDASLQWYKKALQLVWKYRESNAALCASFRRIFMDAKKKFELQRAGGGVGSSAGGSSTSRATGSTGRATTPAVARVSSNAFSGGDRRNPITRPQSAHHRSGAAGGAPDLSYSANVASQCYKPVKPSTAGLQYASSPSKGASAEIARRGSSHGGVHTAQRVARPSSAKASAATSSRQRPLSASAARFSHTRHGDSSSKSRPSIEAHWRRLEKDFAIETSSAPAAAASNTRASQQQAQSAAPSKRPQSARATASSHRAEPSRQSVTQHELDAFAARHHEVISDLEEDDVDGDADELLSDDDDCDVLDDDEPSEDGADNDNDDEICDSDGRNRGDDIADLLLRRSDDNERQSESHYRSGMPESSRRGSAEAAGGEQHLSRSSRHRQALDETRHKTTSFAPELHSRGRNGVDHSNSSVGDSTAAGAATDTFDGGDDDDLPHQRVSHMEYLRRMKRLAENIKDDLTGVAASPAVAASAAGGGARASRSGSAVSSSSSSTSARKSVAPPLASASKSTAAAGVEEETPDATTTPRGSTTSKVRERLERMRSDSYHSLPAFDASEQPSVAQVAGERDCDAESSKSSSVVTSRPAATRSDEFVEIVIDEGAVVCATEQELCAAELTLVQHAAAKCIQALVRGERVRSEARKRQQLRKEEAVREVQARTSAFAQQAREPHVEEDDKAEVQQREAERLAATAIQQAFRARVQIEPPSPCTAASVSSNDALDVKPPATMKGHLTREAVSEHRAAQLSRMYLERKHLEVALHHAIAKELAFLEGLAATKIQALVRGRQSRMLTDATRIGLHAAAETIQTRYRVHLRHVLQSTSVGVHSVAARVIQHAFRVYCRRQQSVHAAVICEELSEVQHIAAASLQRFWRLAMARREVVLEELEAATCIQALGRGHLVRKSMQALRESSSQIGGLSKESSAFSIAGADGAATEHLRERDTHDDDDDYEDDDPAFEDELSTSVPRPRGSNMGFLPSAVRELYAAFVASPSYPDAREQQRASVEAAKDEVHDMALAFDDLMLELETCGDASTACFALGALCVVVAESAKQYLTLPTAVRVARVLDQRIHDHDVWTPDVELAALWLLDAFHDLLVDSI